MTKQEVGNKIIRICDRQIDCDDCPFFSEQYDECIYQVLGMDSPMEWEDDEDGRK